MTVSVEVARDAVVAAMAAAGLSATKAGDDADVTVDVNGVVLDLRLRARSTVTPESLHQWADRQIATVEAITVLVADRVLPSARPALDDLGWGWLDLRGHLRLSVPGVLIDAEVPATRQFGGRPTDPLCGAVGLEVACSLLLEPGEPVRVRARENLGRAPSSVSAAVERLRNEQLITGQDLPAVPDLFWALAAAWRPPVIQLATLPDPANSVVMTALRTGWGDAGADQGWMLTDALAASVHGAPIGVSSDCPPSFYVPDEATARRAESLLGAPPRNAAVAASVRVAPVPQICALSKFLSFSVTVLPGRNWPLAHPLFVALDLAGDPGRGTEILAGWRPEQDTVRVW